MATNRYRVGIYVSGDTRAAADRSLDALRAWTAEHSEWEVVKTYLDVGFGRDDLRRLFADAERGDVDLVVFRSLRDFLPLGTAESARRLGLLTRLGVAFASRAEPHFTTLGAHQECHASFLLTLEAQDRHQLTKRLRRGHAWRKRRRPIGRPRVPVKTRVAIARLREQGKTIAEIAKSLGVAQGTVAKYQHGSIDDLIDLLPTRAFKALTDPTDD